MHRAGAAIVLLGLVIIGCSSATHEPAEDPAVVVETHGALRDIMHGSDTSAVIRLESLETTPQWVGLGALSGLRGEVTVVAGELLLAYPQGMDESVTIPMPPDGEGAALFVSARVPQWQNLPLEHDVTWEDLDSTLATMAEGAGIDIAEAFPFMIDARVEDLEWHVIDGSRIPEGAVGHDVHRNAAVRHSLPDGRAVLVGFYSDHHQGVFTHMNSNTHVHARVDEPLSSGHVDHVIVRAGSTIQLPAAPTDH